MGRKKDDKERGFDQLLSQQHATIQRVCCCYGCGDKYHQDALYQEITLHLWEEYSRYGTSRLQHQDKLSAWVYSIAIHIAKTYNRMYFNHDARHISLSLCEADTLLSPCYLTNNEEVDAFLATQTPDSRLMASLWLEGHTYEAIAEIVGRSSSAVGIRILQLCDKYKKECNKDLTQLNNDTNHE